MVTTVVPFRGDAKRRLPGALRGAVALAMLGDVVAAARPLGPVLVVTDDATVVPPGAEHVEDPGGGQGAALTAALALVDRDALVVNADLPCATPEALRCLAAAGLALVVAPDGTTNALSLPDPRLYAALHGPGSAERFLAHAPFVVVRIPELELDVDTLADLERAGSRAGPRTRALLAVPA